MPAYFAREPRLPIDSLWSHSAALLVLLTAAPAWAVGKPAAGAISAETLKLPDGPGSVAGLSDMASIGVHSAQVQYSVPIDLPKASAGFAPALAVSYLGELGNGPLGVGWTLTSTEIRRSLRQGVPSYTQADELELVGLGGGRLVAIDGTWTQFRVEGRGHDLKVERKGNRFVVTDENGVAYHLGLSDMGRRAEGGRTAAWLVELVTDLSGQTIDFRYERDQGELYLAEILWGPSRMFRARLLYEGRLDEVTSYRTGFLVRTTRRLSDVRIEVLSGGAYQRARAYHFSYQPDFALSRLAQVQVTGRNGLGELPALTFGYATPEARQTISLPGTEGWTLNERGVVVLDVDGDGMGDLVRLEMGGHSWRRNVGGRFEMARPPSGPRAWSLRTRASWISTATRGRSSCVS